MTECIVNLNQNLCDTFLRCPICYKVKTLQLSDDEMVCGNCNKSFKMKHGIPALMDEKELGSYSYKFLELEYLREKMSNPYTIVPLKFRTIPVYALLFLIGEVLWGSLSFYFLCKFLYKYGLKELAKLFITRAKCDEVNKALYYGWWNYFNLILKAGEIVGFNKMSKYISEPSLEIGCGGSGTSNMIFRDKLDSVTFGCEYFMDTYLSNVRGETLSTGMSPDMFKLIKHYVGGSIRSLPFDSKVFNSVYLVHIIDHIVDRDIWFKEINRILKPGGYVVISGYSKYVFDHFPGVSFRKILSKGWAEKYKSKRVTRENPYRGGIPLMNNSNYYATGMNLLTVSEWRKVAEPFGFELADNVFFGNKWFSFFTDMEYRGYYPSLFFNEIIYSAISKMVEDEKKSALPEEKSTNVVLVFRKKKDSD